MVFRLGPTGPMLRFDQGKAMATGSVTMDQIDPDAIAMLELDQERKPQEVDQIAGGALFDESAATVAAQARARRDKDGRNRFGREQRFRIQSSASDGRRHWFAAH